MLKQILSAVIAVTTLAVQGAEKEVNQEETMVIKRTAPGSRLR